MQRTYPGQLPSIRRNIQNAVIPVDFSSKDDVFAVVETMQNMVKRKVPLRWGLVPKTTSPAALEQGKVLYHLLETYGLGAVMKYLDAVSLPSLSIRHVSNICIGQREQEAYLC